MRSPIVTVMGASLLVTAVLTGAALVLSPATVERPAEWRQPTANTLLRIGPTSSSEPRPLVIAWEDGRSSLPSFALYETGLWLRATPNHSSNFDTGALAPREASAMYRRFVSAGLETMPPVVRLEAAVVDGNAMTVCVARNTGWTCASVDGLVALTPTDAGTLGRVGVAVPASAPLPFSTVYVLLTEVRRWPGEPWTPSSFDVIVKPLAPADLDAPIWDGPPLEWPGDLPQLSVHSERLQRVSPLDAAAIRARFESIGGHPLRIRGRLATVGMVAPHVPGLGTILEVRRAFAAFAYGVQ